MAANPFATSIITGINVVVEGFPTFGNLELEETVHAEPIFHSGGGGGADRAAGNIDFRGRIIAWGHTPPTFPGDTFDLSFTINGGDHVLSNSVETDLNTTVRCMGLDIIVPVEDPQQQNAVYYIVEFGAAGYGLSYGVDSAPTDTVAPRIYPVQGLTCLLDDEEEDNVTEMRLSIKNMTEPALNSGTNGVFYRARGNLDWQFTYSRHINELSLLPDKNSVKSIEMQVEAAVGTTAALSWLASYGRVMGPKIMLDRKTRRPISAEITLEMCTNGTKVGEVSDPTITQKWPFS